MDIMDLSLLENLTTPDSFDEDADLKLLVKNVDVNHDDRINLIKLEIAIVLKSALDIYNGTLSLECIADFVDLDEMINIDSPEQLKNKIDDLSFVLQEIICCVEPHKAICSTPTMQVKINKFKIVKEFLDKAKPYFKEVKSICGMLCEKTEINTKDLSCSISKANKKLVKHLQNINDFSINSGLANEFDFNLDESIDLLNEYSSKLDSYDSTKEEEWEKFISSLRKIDVVQEEKIDYVKKANELYVEFCQDWLRDLEKQVPFSTKDQYNALLAKFSKLQKTFSFPLAKNTKEGKAKESCKQLNDLMDRATKISSESYTIGMYR